MIDDDNVEDKYQNKWATMMDKGYQGMQHKIRSIIPKKRTKYCALTENEIQSNSDILHDRILVENFFGRAAKLWGILFTRFTWEKSKFDVVVDICFSLTNFHITCHAFCKPDHKHYHKVVAMIQNAAKERLDKGALCQASYRNKQKQNGEMVSVACRMTSVFEGVEDDVII